MNYRVAYTDSFLADVRDHLGHLRREKVSEQLIEDWYSRLFDRLDALTQWPRTFVVAEAYTRKTGRQTHKINFGKYLVLYQIDDVNRRVELVAFFHGAKDWQK